MVSILSGKLILNTNEFYFKFIQKIYIYVFLSYVVDCGMYVTGTFSIVRVRSCIDGFLIVWILIHLIWTLNLMV